MRMKLGELVIGAALVCFSLFHVYTALTGTFEPLIQRSIFIGVGLFLAFASSSHGGAVRRTVSWMLALAALYGAVHVVANNVRLMDVLEDLTQFDKVVGLLTIACVLEAARRTVGWALPVLAVLALIYYLFGFDLIGGSWRPPRIGTETAMRTLTSQTSGVYGYLADVGTRVIAIFVIYGAFLMATGGGDAFVRLATYVAGRRHGGPAKVAVVSSALFGTVTGSAVANVMAVGTITIPSMTRAGYPRAFAAGVEATASTGGQIMPPIMGAGAFIMAEWLNIPYATIAVAAIIPAFLYFAAVFMSVGAFARLQGIKPTPKHELPTLREVLDVQTALPTFSSIVLLIGLMFAGYTPTGAGGMATVALLGFVLTLRVLTALLRRDGSSLAAVLRLFGRQVLAGLLDAGRNLVTIAAILGCAGIVVTVLSASGVAIKFSTVMTSFAGVDMLWLLMLVAALCIILGMDVPTTASYILTASVAGPAMLSLGLPALTGHLFIFYFAILSAITPPVCASVYAAATIARENFWRVALQSLRIGGAVYVIPFMFVYRPELLMAGDAAMIIYHTGITLLAVYALTGGLLGYFFGPASLPVRVGLALLALLLFVPAPWTDAVGVLAVGGIAALQYFLVLRPSLAESG